MLNARENMIQVIEHGTPDRFVNNYEGVKLMFHPFLMFSGPLVPKGTPVEKAIPNAWGIYNAFPENTPGGFPVQDDAHLLVKDIEHWQDYVKVPSLKFTDEQWGICKSMYDSVDANKIMQATFVAPGLFEQTHHMCKIEEALMAMYECPDEYHDLIKMLTEFELELAEGICTHLKPEAIFHHDDWGSQKSTFMSAAMFEEFFVEPYKEIYGYYKDHGVKYVFHHSDSYAATLVPAMIEMGIDVWQGTFSTNNIPDLISKYGDKITFMGGIENHLVDFDGWTEENNEAVARKIMEECGNKSFIPCIAQGGPGSVFPGVYKSLWDKIDMINTEKFGWTQEQLDDARLPIDIMF
ncbi:MAG: uroporphyrinogen decarboxylase family protein [Eubacteriales bacterium]|nr:uroporphyrinogen decarboxylase family protein [Eubacteriales bacterium]